jgi:hypothetical protein
MYAGDANHRPARCQPTRHERIVEHVANPHGQVDAFLRRIDGSFHCDQLDMRLRIPERGNPQQRGARKAGAKARFIDK